MDKNACLIYLVNRVFITVYPTLYQKIDAELNAAVCCIDLTVQTKYL